jgi:hypothetical protein
MNVAGQFSHWNLVHRRGEITLMLGLLGIDAPDL